MTINDLNKKNCTGCGSCSLSCPKNAIKMIEKTSGFLYPQIDNSLCNKCGLCVKKCHLKKESSAEAFEVVQYAAQHKDLNIVKESTSGGIADAITKYVIDKGGYVCGCIIDNNFDVYHIITNDYNEAKRFRKSKYVQSLCHQLFPEIKNLLNENKLVCFIGSPCQVAGLKSYLGKSYENLLTIDFICHGVPSNKLFKKYLSDVSKHYNQDVKAVDFRSKKCGWKTHMELVLSNQTIVEDSQKNPFLKLFATSYSLRNSCFTCKYRSLPQPADITIGDFWHIKQDGINFDINLGVSKIILNTSNGKKVFDAILNKINYKQMPIKPNEKKLRVPFGKSSCDKSVWEKDIFKIAANTPSVSEKIYKKICWSFIFSRYLFKKYILRTK